MFACTMYRKPPLSFSQSTGFSITIVANRMVHGLYVECWPEPYMQKLLPANHSMIVKCTMYGVLVECSHAMHSGYCSENILCFLNYSWNNMQVLCSKTIQPPSSDPTVVQNIARLLPCDIQSELQLFITIITAYTNRMMYMMHERYFYSFHFFSEIYVHSSVHTLYIGSHQCHSINELQFFITSYTCSAGYNSLRHAYTAHKKLLPLLSTHCHSSYQEEAIWYFEFMSEAWVPFFKPVPLHSRNWVALLTSWYHLAAVCWALQQVRRLGQTICLEFELNAQTQPSFIYTPPVALVHPLNGIFFCWLLYCQNSGSCWDADLKPSVIGIYPPTHVYRWTVYRWVVLLGEGIGGHSLTCAAAWWVRSPNVGCHSSCLLIHCTTNRFHTSAQPFLCLQFSFSCLHFNCVTTLSEVSCECPHVEWVSHTLYTKCKNVWCLTCTQDSLAKLMWFHKVSGSCC